MEQKSWRKAANRQRWRIENLAPGEGIEPPTRRLTAARSASLSYPGTWESYKTKALKCQDSPYFSPLDLRDGRGWGMKDRGLDFLWRKRWE